MIKQSCVSRLGISERRNNERNQTAGYNPLIGNAIRSE